MEAKGWIWLVDISMLIDNRKLSAFRTTELMIRYKYHSQTTDHTFDTVSTPLIHMIDY
jgi:hypothetical protein